MNAATIAVIIQGIADLAPYVAQLGSLAVKVRAGGIVTESDLRAAEASRRRAFTALRTKLLPESAEGPVG